MLAVMVLKEQGLDLLGVSFATPFFGPEPGIEAGVKTGIPVRAVDIGERHLAMLKNPRYGYGSQMNPCIDCHALMLRVAGEMMEEEGADFLFTGEVLGQRPMSQRRDALRSVEKTSGVEGRILRPLSALLLPETLVEREGLVIRERLLDIKGQGRKRQMALAARYGIEDYPQPGGGCMLTKEGFANRLRHLLAVFPESTTREVELLKWGRQFFLTGGSRLVVGRNRKDNGVLLDLARPDDVVLDIPGFRGPVALVAATELVESDLPAAAAVLVSYCDAALGQAVAVRWNHNGREGNMETVKGTRDNEIATMI